MHTVSTIGGSISPLVVVYSVQLCGSWSTPLVVMVWIDLVGALLTMIANPRERMIFRDGAARQLS